MDENLVQILNNVQYTLGELKLQRKYLTTKVLLTRIILLWRMLVKFLIDTNIYIPLEPASFDNLDAATPEVSKFLRLTSEAGHQVYVHPNMRLDFQRDVNENRRRLREILFVKYPCLPNPPSISSKLANILGHAEPGSNDWVDHHLLAALEADAVDYLVSEDLDLHRKAARLSLQARVATVDEAISIIQSLFDITPPPPPAVQATVPHELNEHEPIFESFRRDYPNFDSWLRKCKREHRQTWVIRVDGSLAAICIVKQEESLGYDKKGKILKICTFKVSEKYSGLRYGELLLKTIFDYAQDNKYEWIYITVFDKYKNLIDLLQDFGFQDEGNRTELGEIILTKPMKFSEADRDSMEPLAFNIRYGPFAAKVKDVPSFVIPIQPRYHQLLFPEAEKQVELWPGAHPFGNSIRKAYLSNAPIRTVTPGANLFFYRSQDIHSITVLCVVEDTLVSSRPNEIARFVGKRTVYKFSEIEEMCQRETLAILFRQSRILEHPITLTELISKGILSAAPQSILRVTGEALEWLQNRLGE
jgi:L-amino acid N-acyltransferase YncA